MTVGSHITFWEYTKRSAQEATYEFFKPLFALFPTREPSPVQEPTLELPNPESVVAELKELTSEKKEERPEEHVDSHVRITDSIGMPQEGDRYGTLTTEFLRPLYETDQANDATMNSVDFDEFIASARLQMAAPETQPVVAQLEPEVPAQEVVKRKQRGRGKRRQQEVL